MENWNVGRMGLAEWDLVKYKIFHHLLFIPNIPFFHYSIIPIGY
jgi:hypothetical protein